jgi:pimeloyl-ACP methyl ester carboxylesterase
MLLRVPTLSPQPARAPLRRVSAWPRLAARAAAPAVQRSTHSAADGVALEVLRCAPAAPSGKPPLLFVHGSFHAAWCWEEHWLPFFAAAGFDAYAVSLRGQGGSGARPGGKAAGTLEEHAADLASLARALPAPPVLVGHSFGGLVVQQCVSSRAEAPPVAGVALLCSVPPDGNSAMVRLLRWSSAEHSAPSRLKRAFAPSRPGVCCVS